MQFIKSVRSNVRTTEPCAAIFGSRNLVMVRYRKSADMFIHPSPSK